MYPDRVFSKSRFTALPSFLPSGADFALIPSHDEVFDLVAVKFGHKGALGVGARPGGLGLFCVLVSLFSVSLSLNGVNAWKISTVAIIALVVASSPMKPGPRLQQAWSD
jgi:hypothetical protein